MPTNLENSAVATRPGKGQFSFQSQRKAIPKKCSNYHTTALISHTSQVMLKILQARLQQYMNSDLPDVQPEFRKGKGPSSQSYDFPVVKYGCERRIIKKAECRRTVVLEKTLESPLNCEEIKPVNPKRNQPWIFTGRTAAEVEAPIFWLPDAKNWLIGKYADAGKDGRQEEKGMTKDEMVGWHHWLDGHEFEQALGVGNGQGSLVCYSPWGLKRVGRDWNELQVAKT